MLHLKPTLLQAIFQCMYSLFFKHHLLYFLTAFLAPFSLQTPHLFPSTATPLASPCPCQHPLPNISNLPTAPTVASSRRNFHKHKPKTSLPLHAVGNTLLPSHSSSKHSFVIYIHHLSSSFLFYPFSLLHKTKNNGYLNIFYMTEEAPRSYNAATRKFLLAQRLAKQFDEVNMDQSLPIRLLEAIRDLNGSFGLELRLGLYKWF